MKKIYEGNVKKNFFVFAFPLVLAILFSQAYDIINTIMSGNLIGEEAISAMGSTRPFTTLISSTFWGYGTGFSIYVAFLFGRSDYKKMLNVIKINMLFSSALLILVSVFCIGFHEMIFDILNIEEALRKDAFSYFSVYMGGLVVMNFARCGIYISNALGVTFLPFVTSIITNVINIVGNYVLIKYCGLGIMGTAIATCISSTVVSVMYIVFFIRIFKKLGLKLGGIYFNLNEIRRSLEYAIPTTLQQSVMYICSAAESPLTNLCGQTAISGFTVGMQLYDLNAGIYQSSNKTVSNYIAQCIGAGKHSEIKKGIKIGLTQTMLFLLPFLVTTVLFASPIADAFLESEESLHYAKIFLQFCLPFAIFNCINNLMHAVFRSVGASGYLIISTLVYSVSRIIFSYTLFAKFEIYGIFAATVLSWVTEALFITIIYFSGKWKSAEYKRLEGCVS